MQVVTQVDLPGFKLHSRGKVRDIYEIDPETLLIITTDRMSAFDVIMAEPVPYKGVVLNRITLFWMKRFEKLIKNHLLTGDFAEFPAALKPFKNELEGRSVLVRKARPLPVECIVRGYLAGSGWAEYQKSGMVCGRPLPAGLMESSRLEHPMFTPSTKAELGEHDENIDDERAVKLLGQNAFERVKGVSLEIFNQARAYAEEKGLIISDTKFEFGYIGDEIVLIDEVLTPDSSRFWPVQGYAPGKGQPSFDKQYLRDWLSAQPWDKTPPPPALPRKVIEDTAQKYQEAYTILTGETLKFD